MMVMVMVVVMVVVMCEGYQRAVLI
jgi:hypothetical protein